MTDTPEKKLWMKNLELVQPKSKKGKKVGKKARRKLIVENIKPIKRHPKKTKSKNVNESPGEDEWFCLNCVEPYSNSRAGKKWIKCMSCNDWDHEECAPPGKNFICQKL